MTLAIRICEASGMQSSPSSSQDAAVRAIRLHLAARGVKQSWLADRLSVSPFWVSRRMSGATNFDIEELDRVAAIFGITIERLLSDADAVAVNQ